MMCFDGCRSYPGWVPRHDVAAWIGLSGAAAKYLIEILSYREILLLLFECLLAGALSWWKLLRVFADSK